MRSRAISGMVRGALATWSFATRLLSGTQVANAPRTVPLAVPYMKTRSNLASEASVYSLLTTERTSDYDAKIAPTKIPGQYLMVWVSDR